MAEPVKHIKVTEIPETWEKNALYYVKTPIGVRMFVTSDQGVSSSLEIDTGMLADATTTERGLVNIGTQSFKGNKTLIGESSTVGSVLTVKNSLGTEILKVENNNKVTIQGVTIGRGNGAIQSNTAFGLDALKVTTGGGNVAIGQLTLTNNTTGYNNIGIGATSIQSNTTGYSNIGIGVNALKSNTIGNHNISLGINTMYNNILGSYNIGIGGSALFSISSGSYNIGIGASSIQFLTSGSYNIAYGYYSGRTIADKTTQATAINNSIMIGYNTSPLGNNQTNQIVIGHNANGNGSNTATIGDDNITNLYIGGNGAGIVFKSPNGTKYRITVNDSGNLTTTLI